MLLVFIFMAFSFSGLAQNREKKFLYSVESYKNQRDLKLGSQYSNLLFEVNSSKSLGKLLYTARLKKSLVSCYIGKYWRNVCVYYDSEDPGLSKEPSLTEIAVRFLERHPVRFSFDRGNLVFENSDSLTSGFLKEVKLYYPNEKSDLRNLFESDFSIIKMIEAFKNLLFTIPGDLIKPGDMSLEKGVVYEYKGDVMNLTRIGITDVKSHSQSDVYIRKETGFLKYKKTVGFGDDVIVRTFEPDEINTMHLEGKMDNQKNKIIEFKVEGFSPLNPTQTIQVETDQFGRFNFDLGLQYPVNVTTSTGYQFYLEPGDQVYVESTLTGDSLFFKGIGANNNEFLQNESRLVEKFPQFNFYWEDNQTQKKWFHRADQTTNSCFRMLENYSNSLSPVFYESKYLNYYYGKINRKLDYIFSWAKLDSLGLRHRTYVGLDTIPGMYQSFIYSQEYNRYIENSFLLQFEKFRNFTFVHNDQSKLVPTQSEYIRMASITYSGKVLRDFLEFQAPRVFSSGKQVEIKKFEDIVNEFFDKTKFQSKVLALKHKTSYIEAGNIFPEVKFLDLNNHECSLSAFRGKLVYVMFWRNDALALDKQWNDYMQLVSKIDSERVAFVVVGMEPEFDKWKKYVEAMNLKGINLFINRNTDDFKMHLGNIGSRQFMLIDSNGKVVNSNGPGPFEANLLVNQENKSSVREDILLKILMAVVSVLLILGLIWMAGQARRKRKARINDLLNRLRETELKAIKAQMNPHFLFNSLNSIQNLINQNEIQPANQYLSRFARLLRSVLQYSEKELIPLSDELETTNLYVQLEKLRFNFEYELQVGPEIDIYNTYVPPLLIQPFIENAILHGLQPKPGHKQLKICVEEENSQLLFSIIDNGVGYKSGTSETNHHQGMGNKLSCERIDLLNEKNKGNFKLSIEDGPVDSGGTHVTLSFASNLI
jgi:hypothetical protein